MPQSPIYLAVTAMLLVATTAGATGEPTRLEEVSILGDPDRIDTIPGSAHLLDDEFLARFESADILRVLQSVPGVYLQEEDGQGLRPNIGIRGSGLDRSSRIALLEDGVLIAPAPYAAPAAYYFPTQRRMNSIEVLKGPASVSLGSRTTGGALNMVSTPIPDDLAARADLFAGQDGFREGHLWYGDTSTNAGWLVETVQQRSDGFKQLDTGGSTGFDIRDYVGKFRLNTARDSGINHGVEMKIGYTDQVSDETYLGLTEDDFNATPYRRYAASQLDQIRTTHRQHQLTYFVEPVQGRWSADITVYNNEFSRNWFKLGSVAGTGISTILDNADAFATELAWIRGEQDSPDDALNLRNNNRSYFSRGVQAAAGWQFDSGFADHSLRVGLRLHEDEVDRFQHDDEFAIRDSLLVLTTAGAPGSQSNRVSSSTATSLFIEDRIAFGAWEVSPGLRLERIEMERLDFSTADPDRADGPTRERDNTVDVFIPGLGITYSLDNGWRLIGGLHRGFNPPSPGSSADEEDSTNLEFGARYSNGIFDAELIAFYTDYSNLVGTCTASTGGDCMIGDQFDGGAATIAGVESVVGFEFAEVAGTALRLPLRLAYTWTATAEFDSGFDSGFDPWGEVAAGDELPYVPQHQAQIAADLKGANWRAGLNVSYVDAARTMAGQGPIPAGQGTDSRWTVDLSGSYRLSASFELYGRIDNLLDEDYLVARRPAGLRPGKPRSAVIGFRFEL
ncbi:MAG: TonB-dependent receptor [Gammaproteobacteria bacterium]|nr:TonB-dependent receptor [Gammaproteobacteria bacterium]NNF61170.1 TonB-dependent receptor [Gammaproteobacteria bacterium]NNM19865.1 TonB-dependent receptor [Gammaproteobacteria bacterium]